SVGLPVGVKGGTLRAILRQVVDQVDQTFRSQSVGVAGQYLTDRPKWMALCSGQGSLCSGVIAQDALGLVDAIAIDERSTLLVGELDIDLACKPGCHINLAVFKNALGCRWHRVDLAKGECVGCQD